MTPAPLGFRYISSLTRKSRILAWSAPASPILLGFKVYRSKTPRFQDAVPLTATPIVITFYEDVILERIEGFTYYYFVTGVGQDLVESAPVGPVWQEFEPFAPNPAKSTLFSIRRTADEIRRRHSKILTFDGEVAHYLVRKVAGPLAVDYDNLRRDAPYRNGGSEAGLPTGAYGTRFQGGYEILANMRLRYLPTTMRLSREEMGLTATRTPTMWVVDYPILQPRDVIVRQNNERYRVVTITPQSIGGKVTRQTAALEYLEPQDVAYSLPVPAFVNPYAPSVPEQQLPGWPHSIVTGQINVNKPPDLPNISST